MKGELDLWYELWDRVGSKGLDTWHDLRGEACDGPAPGRPPDTDSPDTTEEGSAEGA
jgi:hypothetical protein